MRRIVFLSFIEDFYIEDFYNFDDDFIGEQ